MRNTPLYVLFCLGAALLLLVLELAGLVDASDQTPAGLLAAALLLLTVLDDDDHRWRCA